MISVDVVRVFTGPDGKGGNLLGVVMDGPSVPDAARQAAAARLKFSETVFVDDPAKGRVAIFTPVTELDFAGHPLVGVADLLAARGYPVDALHPPAGEVPTWAEDGARWIRGRAEWAPPMDIRQLSSPSEVDAQTGFDSGFVVTWAWVDESIGIVRSRVFPVSLGIREDEATGAAAVRLVSELGRPVRIVQGCCSVLRARLGPNGTAEVGGTVSYVERRELD